MCCRLSSCSGVTADGKHTPALWRTVLLPVVACNVAVFLTPAPQPPTQPLLILLNPLTLLLPLFLTLPHMHPSVPNLPPPTLRHCLIQHPLIIHASDLVLPPLTDEVMLSECIVEGRQGAETMASLVLEYVIQKIHNTFLKKSTRFLKQHQDPTHHLCAAYIEAVPEVLL